jgi:hypothetical protein
LEESAEFLVIFKNFPIFDIIGQGGPIFYLNLIAELRGYGWDEGAG